MESIQAIKTRIQSIGSTRQITQSMRLVSTAKVQKARNRMTENQPFIRDALRIAQIAGHGLEGEKHKYVTPRPVQQSAVVVISSDRGLCGGYSINVCKEAFNLMANIGKSRIVTVGLKARDYCRRRAYEDIAHSVTNISERPFFEDAQEIAQLLLQWYDQGEVDQIYVVYTEFESMLVQNPKSVKLLPLELEEDTGYFHCEPGGAAYLERVIPFYLASYMHGAILESSACEQSARITSMDAAVKNSDEMIESLTLLFNQARQGAITQELTEIINGAGAV